VKTLKRLTVWNSDGKPELYVQVDAEGVKLAQMYDRLRADLDLVTAERDALRRKLAELA
jgi:hypothetical protein